MDTYILNICDSLDYFLIAGLVFNVIKKKYIFILKTFFNIYKDPNKFTKTREK